jgi:hypothetical protein
VVIVARPAGIEPVPESRGWRCELKSREDEMRRVLITLVAVTSLVLAGGFAGAQSKPPDATVELSEGSVAAGIGFTWGKGTLTYKGQKFPVKVEGLSVGEVGINRATARGNVFDLKKVEDFSGNYTAGGAGATVGGGVGGTIMRNQNGVVIELTSTTQGASLKLAASGIRLTLDK